MTTGVLNHKITRRGFLKTSAALGAVAALGDRLFGGPLSTLMVGAQVEGVVSDKWMPSSCDMCRGGRDLIRGHVVNGVLVAIEGQKEHEGMLPTPSLCCVKPRGLVQWVYNPYRLKAPMKRTNPNKGMNEDPGFVEISWDEALDTLADKLKEIQAMGVRNERGFTRVIKGKTGYMKPSPPTWNSFWSTFGPTENWGSYTESCYGLEHHFAINWHYNYATTVDLEYANWFLSVGKNHVGATIMGYGASGMKELADFKVRGGKDIYLSPYQGITGAKADEWIAIKQSTDAAFLYAMVNVILSEMDWRQVADLDFLKKVSSSPYLVTPRGYWARDPATKKPLVWDSVAGAAKVEDDPTIGDFALDGGPYTLNAVEVDYKHGADDPVTPETPSSPVTQATPSFQLMIDHFKSYTPEWAAPITDVPAKTIRRIAHEFVENSMVGSTIRIDGYTYRYRPATIMPGKPTTSGVGCTSNLWAIGLLYMLMGSIHAPGGLFVAGTIHSSQEQSWTKEERIDGMRPFGGSLIGLTAGRDYATKFHWPPPDRNMEGSLALMGAFQPLAQSRTYFGEAMHTLPGSLPDAIVVLCQNLAVKTNSGPQRREGLAKIPFFAHFAKDINETNWYADIIMPDALGIVEDWQNQNANPADVKQPSNSKNNFYAPFQPMVNSPVNARDVTDIMTDLAARMGPEFLATYNEKAMGADADPTRKYTVEEIMDYKVRTDSSIPAELRGQYGLDYYKEHGAIFWPVSRLSLNYYREQEKTATRYDLPYQEGFKRAAEKRIEDLHGVGINWRDNELGLMTHGLLPYEDARAIFEEVYEAGGEYDLRQGHHRVHQFGFHRNKEAPWEIEVEDPESSGIVINPETAERKGLKNGDWVALETRLGGRTTGRLIVSPTIHPDSVEIADHGLYRTPIARGQGVPVSAEIEVADSRLIAGIGHIKCSGAIVRIYKTEKIIPNIPV